MDMQSGVLKIRSMNKQSILILLIFIFFMWGTFSTVWGYKITHDYPAGYLASDSFWHQVYSQYVYDTGSARYNPAFISYNTSNVAFHQPPLFYHLPSLLKYMTGLNMWDCVYLIAGISLVFIVLIFFIFIYKYNSAVALLSLPISIFVLTFPFYKILAWGWYLALIGLLFMSLSFYILYNWKNIRYSYIFYGLALSATGLAHLDCFAYGLGFMIIFVIYKFWKKDYGLKEFKEISISVLIILLLCTYHILILQNTIFYNNSPTQLITFKPNIAPDSIRLSDFGLYLYPILLGILISMLFSRKKNYEYLLLPTYLFLISLSEYIGYDRIIRFKFLLPVFLSFFFGIFMYAILIKIKIFKEKKILFGIIAILLFAVTAFSIYTPNQEGMSITNPYSWNAFDWIKTNIPKEKEILFIYDEMGTAQGAILWNSERVPVFISPGDLNENFLENLTTTGLVHCSAYAIQNNWHSFTSLSIDKKLKKCKEKFKLSVCDFEYVYISGSGNTQISAYLEKVIKKIAENTNFEIIYSNKGVFIFRNKKVGACL